MTIGRPFIEGLANVTHPFVDIHLATRQTEATLAAKGHPFHFLAVFTPIGAVARSQIATTEHLFHDLDHLRPEVVAITLPEGSAVIAEDLLKGRFIDTCGWDLHHGHEYHDRTSESTPTSPFQRRQHSSSSPRVPGWRAEKGNSYTIKLELVT